MLSTDTPDARVLICMSSNSYVLHEPFSDAFVAQVTAKLDCTHLRKHCPKPLSCFRFLCTLVSEVAGHHLKYEVAILHGSGATLASNKMVGTKNMIHVDRFEEKMNFAGWKIRFRGKMSFLDKSTKITSTTSRQSRD